MSFTADHQRKFADLQHQIQNQDLRRQANGGNSILFSYPPEEEYLYLKKAREVFHDSVAFIDISKLFVAFIDALGWDEFQRYFSDFKDTPYKVFRSENEDPDLFNLILVEIQQASDHDKIPFLFRTGCLVGTGIENANIMEHTAVMKLKHPLIIFYPSSIVDGNLLFLNYKPASKYRCTLVN